MPSKKEEGGKLTAESQSSRQTSSSFPDPVQVSPVNAAPSAELLAALAEKSDDGAKFAQTHGLTDPEDIRAFEKGAQLSHLTLHTLTDSGASGPGSGSGFNTLSLTYGDWLRAIGCSEDEIQRLEKEARGIAGSFRDKFSHPKTLYLVVIVCSICAAVQGMDETVVNGAQVFYSKDFGIEDPNNQTHTWIVGAVNAAPYICSALLGCWLTGPLNHFLGRKGTIWVTCAISAAACIAQAFPTNWKLMFVFRFLLGLGIGPKSATVPMYASECSPPAIRGALGTQWQMWTAFGIMLGFALSVAFYDVHAPSVPGLNWRLMMASAALPAFLVFFFAWSLPESPRWYMTKTRKTPDGVERPRVGEAYAAMRRLRRTRVEAARDLYHMQELLEAERRRGRRTGGGPVRTLCEPRTRRAFYASQIVMTMQQFCGINVIAYYSSSLFVESGFDERMALVMSLVFGVLNWVCAIPATLTIDSFGRRNLLLATFPFLSLFLFWAGFSFYIPVEVGSAARLGSIATAIYLFAIFYSPGAGPVPFTYSAEAYPLHARSLGMSIATATTWFFNALLALTWPSMHRSLGATGAFCFYAACNVVGFFMVLFFVPETKGRTLEELDDVFSVPTRMRFSWGCKQASRFLGKHVLQRKMEDLVPAEKQWEEKNAQERRDNDKEAADQT